MKSLFTILFCLVFITNVQSQQNEQKTINTDSSASYNIPEYVVTATRTEKNVFFVPREVEVFGAKEISAMTVKMLPDLFESSPSVTMQKTNYGGGSPIMRGLIGNRILILVDGIRLNNSTFRFGPNQYLNTVDASMIEKVEVVDGPGSVLYGSDALGGVINIITKNAQRSSVSTTVSSADNSIVEHVSLHKSINNLNIAAGGSYKKFDDVRDAESDQIPTGFSEYDAYSKIEFSPVENHSMTAMYQFSLLKDVPRTDRIISKTDLQYNFTPQQRELAYIKYNASVNSSFVESFSAVVSYSRQLEGREVISMKNTKLLTKDRDDVHTIGMNIDFHSLVTTKHLLTYGFEYYNDLILSNRKEIKLATNAVTTKKSQFPNGSTYNTIELFLQDEINFSPFYLTLGLRYSSFEFSGELDTVFGNVKSTPSTVTSSASLLYNVTQSVNLIAGFSEGFRAPNTDDIAKFGKSGSGTGARYDVPSLSLEPEKSMNYEFGIKYRDENIRVNLFSYLAEYVNLITPKRSTYNGDDSLSGYPVYANQNIDEAKIYGWSADVMWNLDRNLTARGTVMLTRGENITEDEPLSRIPPMRGFLSARYDFTKSWVELYSTFSMSQQRLSTADIADFRIGPNGTNEFWTGNIRGGLNFSSNVSAIVSVENVFNRYYKIHGSGINSPGRNFTIRTEIIL
ncbi:MAG: TonB-dependent receptor [Bacteroidota bacterium]